MRVVGVIIKDGKILLIHRIKNTEAPIVEIGEVSGETKKNADFTTGQEYYVFPGGRMEEGETQEEALKREMKEETGLDIVNPEKIFEIDNRGVRENYFLITDFSGILEVGGPEKERMSEQNQYLLEWINLIRAAELKNLVPREAVQKLKRLPETHPSPEYYKAISKKRMASGLLLFNEEDQILLVKPSYKDHWSIPGGITDADESPRQTAIRETKEEVNINLRLCQFLCLDYVSNNEIEGENLQFIFYGGILKKEEIEKIKIDKDEIGDYKFVNIDESTELLGGPERKLSKRLPKCLEALKNNTAIYLENGNEVEV